MKSAIETFIDNIKIASSAAILAGFMTLGTEAKADQFSDTPNRVGTTINSDNMKWELGVR
jgi:hypothetical protein